MPVIAVHVASRYAADVEGIAERWAYINNIE